MPSLYLNKQINFGGRKTLEVQIGVGVPVKLSVCSYIVLGKSSTTNSVITLAKSVGTHAFTTVLRVCKPGNEFIHIRIFKSKLNSDV